MTTLSLKKNRVFILFEILKYIQLQSNIAKYKQFSSIRTYKTIVHKGSFYLKLYQRPFELQRCWRLLENPLGCSPV